jgi:hypothetical protein
MASLEILPVANPQQKRHFLRERWLEFKQLHRQLTSTDLNRPVRYLSKRNAFFVLQLGTNTLTNLILTLLLVLHTAASPISEYFNPEILVFLKISVNFKGEIVLLVSEQYLQQLVIAHKS